MVDIITYIKNQLVELCNLLDSINVSALLGLPVLNVSFLDCFLGTSFLWEIMCIFFQDFDGDIDEAFFSDDD